MKENHKHHKHHNHHSHNGEIERKFDPKRLERLNNPIRLEEQPPEYIWDKLNLQNHDVLIDIGSGSGFFSVPYLNMAQKFNGDAKVYACDISETMLEWMEENIIPHHPNIILVKMEESSVPLEDSIADLVFMINLHHELEEPDEMLKEVLRLLKPSGKICIVDWGKKEIKHGPPLQIRYEPEEVETQLMNTGFKNIEIDYTLPKHFIVIGEKPE